MIIKLLLNVAFSFNLRRYDVDTMKKYITTLYYLPVDGSAQQSGTQIVRWGGAG